MPLNQELNNCARNTNDASRLRQLVAQGADLASTNGGDWRHTPLHQACFHNRPLMVKALLELGAYEKCARSPRLIAHDSRVSLTKRPCRADNWSRGASRLRQGMTRSDAVV